MSAYIQAIKQGKGGKQIANKFLKMNLILKGANRYILVMIVYEYYFSKFSKSALTICP